MPLRNSRLPLPRSKRSASSCNIDNELELSRVAEALRKATEAAGFYYRGKKIHVTISLGLTLARPDDTLSSLLSRADNALYEAKNHGRNQFALAA